MSEQDNSKIKSNMHKIPRSILRQFRPDDMSEETWEKKIAKIHSETMLIEEAHLKWLDRIYHAFERYIPDIIKIIENNDNSTFKLEGNIKKKFNRNKFNQPFGEWTDQFSFDEKFTEVLIDHMLGNIPVVSSSRFASVLELLVIGCFVRSIKKSSNEYDLKAVKEEHLNLNMFINAMTPVEILCTDKPREIDNIENIITWDEVIETNNYLGFDQRIPYLRIRIRLSKRITLTTYLRQFWKQSLVSGMQYSLEKIFYPKIKREK